MTWVSEARSRAYAAGFSFSCSEGTADLLGNLVRTLSGDVRAGEVGSGYGVGTAAIAAALPVGGTLVSVELDAERAQQTRELFADDARVQVVTGNEQALLDFGPFDFVFLDGGPKPTPEGVLRLLRVGGVAVIDDFTPSENPEYPQFEDRPDWVRLAYRDSPSLGYAEYPVSDHEVAVVLTRRD